VAASNPADAMGLLASCIEDDDPCIFIENVAMYGAPGPAPATGHRVPLGKAAIARAGSDVSVISYSRAAAEALAVAEKLAKDGVNVEVIDLRTIAPFDAETVLNSVTKTKRAVVVHEAIKPFGVGAEISARIHEELFDTLKRPVQRVASRYSAVPFSPALEQAYLFSQADIETAIRKTLEY
jgi:pyruvate/2-oxoglutarate/acetoin dehydrogenase E1 component